MAKKAELRAVLSLDASNFRKVLAGSLSLAKSFGKSIGSTAFGAISSAFSKLRVAVPLAGAALAAGTVHAYNFGSEMQDLHDITGAAVEKLVVLKQGLADNGVEIESLVPSLGRMSKALVAAQQGGSGKVFEQIGLHVKDLMDQDPVDNFLKIGDAINHIQNQSAKLAANSAIFGKGTSGNLAFFADPKAMETAAASVGKQAQLLGKNSEVFDRISDRLGRVFVKIRGFFVGVAASLAPVMDKMTALFDKVDLSGWGQKLGDAIKTALAWLVAFWNEPQRTTAYFWEYAKVEAMELGNILLEAGEKFGAAIFEGLKDALTGGALARELAGGAVAGALGVDVNRKDLMGAGTARERLAMMRPNDAFENARRMIGDVAGAGKASDTQTPWRLRGFHGTGQLLANNIDRFHSSLQGASMGGYLNQRGNRIGSTEGFTRSLSNFHQGAYDRSPVLSATALRRITRAGESEAAIRERHRLGNFAAGDTHRLKKIAMEQARKEAGALTDNEALVDIAKNSKRTADALES